MNSKAVPILVFTGAESTGKTTLCKAVAEKYKLPWLDEAARNYLENLGGKYTYEDVIEIAKIQRDNELTFLSNQLPCYLLDTDLLTIKIWLEDKFSECPDWIKEEVGKYKSRKLYVHCFPDFEWKFDPLREDGHRQKEITQYYASQLEQLKLKHINLKGTLEDRINHLSLNI